MKDICSSIESEIDFNNKPQPRSQGALARPTLAVRPRRNQRVSLEECFKFDTGFYEK